MTSIPDRIPVRMERYGQFEPDNLGNSRHEIDRHRPRVVALDAGYGLPTHAEPARDLAPTQAGGDPRAPELVGRPQPQEPASAFAACAG